MKFLAPGPVEQLHLAMDAKTWACVQIVMFLQLALMNLGLSSRKMSIKDAPSVMGER